MGGWELGQAVESLLREGAPVPPVPCVVVVGGSAGDQRDVWGGAPLGSGGPFLWALAHTLDIDGKRDVAPSPTPGFPLDWMLLSNVSSAFSEE